MGPQGNPYVIRATQPDGSVLFYGAGWRVGTFYAYCYDSLAELNGTLQFLRASDQDCVIEAVRLSDAKGGA